MKLTLTALAAKLTDPEWAAARVTTTYQPSGGPGSKVFPPTFPTSPSDQMPYLIEERTCDGQVHRVVVLDQVPSQANRCEEALAAAWRRGQVRLPMLRLVHQGTATFEVIGLDAPHRAFDAYWRDSLLEGKKFDATNIGKALQAVSPADATALLQYDPGTLVYGGWNSHRKGRQAKFPRLYNSELIGWEPELGTRKAGRMDPANLTGSRAGDADTWAYSPNAAKKKESKLSEIGHGNIAPNAAHGGVTITQAVRLAVLSLTATRRIQFGPLAAEAQDAARVMLLAIALLGDRLAFGGAGLWLRSGCDLVQETETLEWIGRGGVTEEFTVSGLEAIELYAEAADRAVQAGAPVQFETVDLVPSPALAKAIEFSLTKAESSGE